jgi:hypothetical protein
MKKVCSKCFIEKDIDSFHKQNKSKDGHVSECKSCRKLKSKKDYHINKIKVKKIIKNKKCVTCSIEKDINLFHRHVGASDGYRSICKECRRNDFKKTYSSDNNFADKHKVRTKTWRTQNKDKYNNYFKERYKKLPHIYAWRGLLSSVFRRMGTTKEKTTIDVLGYSAEDLKIHIESLFLDNMSWDNWGEWQIDHIKPISLFNKDDDPKIINSLSNLQPLWAKDNRMKSNKF